MNIAITGSRYLTVAEANQVESVLVRILPGSHLLVGCAPGVDALGRQLAEYYTLFIAEGHKPWQLQARSKKMVDAMVKDRSSSIAAVGGTLHGFPNKPCPADLTISSWKGSGTWGTLRYAVSLGVSVAVHTLADFDLPQWLTYDQLVVL